VIIWVRLPGGAFCRIRSAGLSPSCVLLGLATIECNTNVFVGVIGFKPRNAQEVLKLECLIRWYCGQCGTEFTANAPEHGHMKAECPKCKDKTDYDEIFELETLQVG